MYSPDSHLCGFAIDGNYEAEDAVLCHRIAAVSRQLVDLLGTCQPSMGVELVKDFRCFKQFFRTGLLKKRNGPV